MSQDQKFIQVRDLKIAFPPQIQSTDNDWKSVVKGIDFSIFEGEILGMVGESGSGKSISASFLIGLTPKIAQVNFSYFSLSGNEFENLDNLLPFQKQIRGKEIGIIFQEPMSSLNPILTCGQQLEEAILIGTDISAQAAEEKALSLFEKVQLEKSHLNRYPHQLSGGQLQRVMIAIAICNDPKLLIADEPTTALDAIVKNDILILLKQLNKELGLAILFISHDLPSVAQIADRILVMRNGQILERGETNIVLESPQHPYTKGLLACLPTFKTNLKRLPTLADFESEKSNDSSPLFLEKEPSSGSILKIDSLSVSYSKGTWFSFRKKSELQAVKNLSFEVFQGETLGIVGESGSGKSTLGKAILNLVNSKSGSVAYKSQNLTQLTDSQWFEFRKDLQIIFQNPMDSLNPSQSIGAAIEEAITVFEPKKSKSERNERVVQLLENVGLIESDSTKFPHEFSGGQRQRICIARALAVKPKILICDECVSSLDVSVQATILNLLKDLQEQFGLTLLFISHDLAVVKFMADRILVMKNGEMVEMNESRQLFEEPKTEYVRRLLRTP